MTNHSHHHHSHEHNHADKNILIAFILNLGFAIYEFIGGNLTGSVAIVSDAIHDIGDALSIGISYILEKRSQKSPNSHYTYGYKRYSLVGGLITTLILIFGSAFVIYNAINRIIHPVAIEYDGMIVLAIIGVVVNFCAAYFTHGGHSLNQKSVNLHMLEDVLGWVVVLIGAIVMRFTGWALIDPTLSIGVAIFILREALTTCWQILQVFLEKVPADISPEKLRTKLLKLPNVDDIHHLHVWSIDGEHHYATLHAVYHKSMTETKAAIKSTLHQQGIDHTTVEMELASEHCTDCECHI